MLLPLLICALMVGLALWFVLPALLEQTENRRRDELRAANVRVYQDQYQELEADLQNGLISEAQYKEDKDELERRLLEDVGSSKNSRSSSTASPLATRKLAYSVGTLIPLGAIAIYLVVGNPKALTRQVNTAANPPFDSQAGEMSEQQIAANVEKLARRLEQDPNDAQGWIMLGRSYRSMNRFADAATAYEHATKLRGNDATVWADYGEALAMANGRQMAGKPLEAINRALQLDPNNQAALVLAGSAAFQIGDYQKAIDFWQKLLPQLPVGSEMAKSVSDQIAKAKQLAAGRPSR